MSADTATTDRRSRWRLVGVLAFVLLVALPWGVQMGIQLRWQLYVPSEDAVIDKMFELAKVTKDDVVFDLGCGDGRIVVAAAKKFGCKGVGVEFNQARIEESREVLQKAGVTRELVEIRFGDARKVPDLERATVILLYLLPPIIAELEPQIKTRLKPGTRVVSEDYPFPTLQPDDWVDVSVPGGKSKRLYLWRIRAAKK